MDASIVAERDELAIVAIADAGEVAQVQRHLLDGETRHEHLHDGRVLQHFERVTAAAGGEGVQSRRAREQFFLNLLPLRIAQGALINQHRREVAVEGALRVRRFAGVVRVDAPTDDHLVEADDRGLPLAVAELDAVEEDLVALRPDLRADGEDVEILEGQSGGKVLPWLKEIVSTRAARRFDIQHADLFRGRRPLIEIDAAGVIVLPRHCAGEHPRE